MTKINESYLDNAIVFNNQLNPAIWINNQMKPEVREALLAMAEEFKDFVGIDDMSIVDLTISGSNAAYTYTQHSDIDLHLVVEIPKEYEELYLELFDAKKNLYNLTRDQKIKGFDVEFYVQDVEAGVESLGIFSVMHDKWINIPEKPEDEVDDVKVKEFTKTHTSSILSALGGNDLKATKKAWDDYRDMRKVGLDREGEFSPENLAYKLIRSKGLQDQLYQHIIDLKDRDLSLEALTEQKLTELLDSNVEFDVDEQTSTMYQTSAVVNDRLIEFSASKVRNLWYIDFSELSDGNRNYGMTNSGGEYQVFSMVLTSLREFVKLYEPDRFTFSASQIENTNRAKLYTKLLKRHIPSNYSVNIEDSRITPSTIFDVRKIQ